MLNDRYAYLQDNYAVGLIGAEKDIDGSVQNQIYSYGEIMSGYMMTYLDALRNAYVDADEEIMHDIADIASSLNYRVENVENDCDDFSSAYSYFANAYTYVSSSLREKIEASYLELYRARVLNHERGYMNIENVESSEEDVTINVTSIADDKKSFTTDTTDIAVGDVYLYGDDDYYMVYTISGSTTDNVTTYTVTMLGEQTENKHIWNFVKTISFPTGSIFFKKIEGITLGYRSINIGDGNMANMFYNCNNLSSIDLSSFNTSNVKNMANMFYNCKKLVSLDVSNFDTSKVTNMSSLFIGCGNLTSIKVANCSDDTKSKLLSQLQTDLGSYTWSIDGEYIKHL